MEYLTELNDLQLKAVTTTSKKVLVIAGAGSGKTKVLTTRIKYLLDSGVRNDEILAFTFTKKAAKEMKDRLLDYNFYNVFTFHSYCYQQIISNPRIYGLKDDLYVIDDNYKQLLISNIIESLNIKKSISSILKYIGKRKNGIDVGFDNPKDEYLFNQIYYEYQEYLMNCGAIDFDDMIPVFKDNFNNIPEHDYILRKTKYILVDECQDTNQIQYDLIFMLASLNKNIFMVGDDKQLIYSFRSSDIEIMKDFRSQADEIITLKQNYRSAKNILDASNKLISNNKFIYENDIYSEIPKKYEVQKMHFSSTLEEAEAVTTLIDILLKRGYNPKDIAILYRNNYQSNQLEIALTNKRIPYVIYGKRPFIEQIECKKIISAYRFIKNPNDKLLFYMLLPIKDEELNAFREQTKNVSNILDYSMNSSNEVIRNIAIRIKDIINNKYGYKRDETFEYIREALFGNISKTNQLEHVMLLKNIIVSSDINDECEIINQIILDEDIVDKPLGVRLLTIHKAKGLEFKCVFIISVNDGIIPSSTVSTEIVEEERRLMYVAMTRAKEFLCISSADYHFINGIRKKLSESIFKSEINETSSENMSHMI